MKVRCHNCRISVTLALLLTLLVASLASGEDVSLDDGRRFVAVGQLATVRAPRGNGRRYVLMDELGEVTHNLRAAKNVDLSEYVGQEVGVTARTLVDSETPILLAENVTSFGVARQVSGESIQRHVALASHEAELSHESIVSGPIVHSNGSVVSDGYPVVDGQLIEGEVIGEPIMGETIVGGSVMGEPLVGEHYFPQAAACGPTCDGNCGGTCAACPCGLPGRFWIRAEYLIWWTDGMDIPALVTTSPAGTPANQAGVLGQPGTRTLFGDEALFSDARSGARFRIGKWCDDCNWLGFETDFFFLSDEDQNYHDCTIGPDIVARPFFNVQLNRQDSEIAQFPGLVNGAVKIDANTSLWGIGPRLRVNLACERFADPCAPCDPCVAGGYRFDLMVGYRYMQLQDSLRIRETLATTNNTNQQTFFDLRDSFDSSNDFHGADLGFLWEGYRGPWSLELIGRVGIGNTEQQVNIDGSTRTTTAATTVNDPGGLLALSSNIGQHSRNEFTVLPEFSATLGYALSPRSRFLVGYTFIYWNNVVRAGDHIDLNVNPALLPPVQQTTASRSPAFAFTETSFWAQGLSLGLEYRW